MLGGAEPLPGLLIQAPPHIGGVAIVELVKPLKPDGAGPPLKDAAAEGADR